MPVTLTAVITIAAVFPAAYALAEWGARVVARQARDHRARYGPMVARGLSMG